ncbi:GLPGLI family protein [Faecalibacter macacae]|uniref:GLPGLI family protein n=1 Tax=Faecalibacter macacae TaxID=1859289 RepID=A0A3L9M894_9FLAO|nr:GLPGLI family protein [Faecalibacter macacae]RLZ08763.1 GLPGLI family protein [Faecalibacter macacae]
MKKLLSVALFASVFFVNAQEKLEIQYKFEYAFDLSKADKSSTLDFYKSSNENTAEFSLVTSKTEAVFNPIEKLNNQQDKGVGKLSILPPKDSYYVNYETKELVELKNMIRKVFIVSDSLSTYNWTIQKDKSKLLGYDVKKAIAIDGKYTYEAWFAPSLNFKSGPFKFNGLPGVILQLTEIDAQGHKKITTAFDVKINDKAKIERPTKGEVISKEGYNEYVEEMMKRQQEMLNNRVNKKID